MKQRARPLHGSTCTLESPLVLQVERVAHAVPVLRQASLERVPEHEANHLRAGIRHAALGGAPVLDPEAFLASVRSKGEQPPPAGPSYGSDLFFQCLQSYAPQRPLPTRLPPADSNSRCGVGGAKRPPTRPRRSFALANAPAAPRARDLGRLGGHHPEAFKDMIVPWLCEDGFDVTVANSLEPI